MNKKILFLVLLGIVLIPSLCIAADPCVAGTNTINGIICGAAASLKSIGIGLAIVAFCVAGIMYITASGNPARMGTAKTALVAAVIGIVIFVLASSAMSFVKTFFGFS